jgi:hypothetical protein
MSIKPPELCLYLRRQGVYFHDTTICTDLELDLTRGHEIQLWLNECEAAPQPHGSSCAKKIFGLGRFDFQL